MSVLALTRIRKAVGTLNPTPIREMAEYLPRIALYAASTSGYERLENFLLRDLSPRRRAESAPALIRNPNEREPRAYDVVIYDEDVPAPRQAFVYRLDHEHQLVEKILSTHQHLGVALAKHFLPFRQLFVERVIAKTCRENTLFSLATALPDVIPSIIELPWAVAEFASDTAFLTMNQVHMAFLIAAASDREVGYARQKSEIATVIGSAFGWRALARQLVGKVPFGGGLLAKAAVAYAGTRVLGLSLDRLYRIGYTYTREERDRVYGDAYSQGKRVAARLLHSLRPDLATKLSGQSSHAPVTAAESQIY